jgi:uncharacterized damage-inducible protein DinB
LGYPPLFEEVPMAALPQLIDSYLAGPAALRRAVAGLSREQLRARPIAGKWSMLEVVCHIADFEPVYADRMKRVIAEERPSLLGADEQRFAAALAYHDRNLDEELSIVEQTRSQMARILRTLPSSALERVGVHNEAGPLSLAELITRITDHIPHHVKFIAEKRTALGLPAEGIP